MLPPGKVSSDPYDAARRDRDRENRCMLPLEDLYPMCTDLAGYAGTFNA